MSAADILDDALDDDEGGYSRLREDGWGNSDICNRDHLDADGRYAGPKDEL